MTLKLVNSLGLGISLISMDQELAQIIAQFANEARASVLNEIPGYLATRQITRLYHFTSARNLESLAANGFLGKDSLAIRNIEYIKSDEYRQEPILDGVCFSLSRPNFYMAAKKIQQGKNDLVLLELLDVASILTRHNFVAVPGNFGSSQLKSKVTSWPEEFIGAKGLMNLFQARDIREKFSIPSFEPTDPQAEIIILDPLPWIYVKKIYFPNVINYLAPDKTNKMLRKLPIGSVIQSQIKDVFPTIDWSEPSIASEYNERKWNENWKLLN